MHASRSCRGKNSNLQLKLIWPLAMFKQFFVFIFSAVQTRHIGCYADKAAAAIPSLEGKDPLLDGDPKTREEAEQICARVALKSGYVYFAIQDGGNCHSSLTAQDNFNKYGLSSDCQNGKGGEMASDVYEVIMFSKYGKS